MLRPLRLVAVLVGALVLWLGARPLLAAGEAWAKPLRQAADAQDAEIARSSAKAVWARLESQTSRNPDDWGLLYLLARAYGKDDRRADAITTYGQCLAKEPGVWLAWRDRGVLHWLEKNPKAAESDLRRAISLDPNYLEAIQPLGALLLEQGRPKEAIETLKRALEIDPRLDSARIQIVEGYLALNAPDHALRTLEPLLGQARNDPRLLLVKARILAHKSDFAGAQALAKDVALRNPEARAPLVFWLDCAIRAKSLDADEGIWVLERLQRLARSKEEQAKIRAQIDDLRRQAAAKQAPPPTPKGPPTPSELAAALRAEDVAVRERALFYILERTREDLPIQGELTAAILSQLRRVDADPAKDGGLVRNRALALEVLGRYATPEFAIVVIDSLRDPSSRVRCKAADVIADLGSAVGIAALWHYALDPRDPDLAISARRAVYVLAQKPFPVVDEDPKAQADAFRAWWESAAAQAAKTAAIDAVVRALPRFPEKLLFRFAYQDGDEVVAKKAYVAIADLVTHAEGDAPWSKWMRSFPKGDVETTPPEVRRKKLADWYVARKE